MGIQAASGAIYFSARQPERGTFLYWSRDFGATWEASKLLSTSTHGLDECSIAWLHNASDGRILMNCRTRHHERASVEWSPYGKPSRVVYSGVTDPNCQGSLVQSGGALWLSSIRSKSSRSHLHVSRSMDHGRTWVSAREIRAGPAAYSQLVPLDAGGTEAPGGLRRDARGGGGGGGARGVPELKVATSTKLGLLFEGGAHCAYETITFASLTLTVPSRPASRSRRPHAMHMRRLHGATGETADADGAAPTQARTDRVDSSVLLGHEL